VQANERFEQENEQQMSQHEGSGRALIGTRRTSQTDQAFQPLEGKLDAPAHPVKGKDIGSGEGLRIKRGDQDDPIGGSECTLRDLMATFSSGQMRLAPGAGGRLRRFLDGD
jgi:hypothetical protein